MTAAEITSIFNLDFMNNNSTNGRKFKLFCGSASPGLSESIAAKCNTQLGKTFLGRFSDGEIQFELLESVRGSDVYLIQSTHNPCNDNIMELLIMADTMKRASARSICAVIPYYGYGRQDRKTAPRTPISARLIADLIATAGFDRVITVDLHAGQIQGFFNFPLDHLFFGTPVAIPYIGKKYSSDDLVVVSPDAGGTERARIMAKMLKCPLAIVDKRRSAPNKAEAHNLIGDVDGKVAVIFDDIVDTAGTLCQSGKLIKEEGASKVIACATHPVFSGPAIERLSGSDFHEIIVSDTISLKDEAKKLKNLTVLSMSSLIGETIMRIQSDVSVSELID